MDYYDRKRIEEKAEEVAQETRHAVRDALSGIESGINDSNRKQEKIFEAFNAVTVALEKLSEEMRGLRADLNPELDKTRKLPPPGAKP